MNCFNSETFLAEAIDSALAQTFSDFEIVFWDNQSTDRSADIARSFNDSRIQYFYAPTHTTLGEARNLAAKCARGEWLAFLDCDDLWTEDKLAKQVAIMNGGDERLGLIYARTGVLGGPRDGQELVLSRKGQKLPEGRVLHQLLLEDNFIPLVSAIIRKSAYWAVGGIPSSYRQAEDLYIFAAIAADWNVRAVDDVCCFYRIHSNNYTRLQKALAYDETIAVIKTFFGRIDDRGKSLPAKNYLIKSLDVKAGVALIQFDRRFLEGMRRILRNGLFFPAALVLRALVNRQRLF